MKRMLKILPAAACCLLLFSCKKGNDTSATGKVLNSVTNQPIEGIKIVVFENKQGLLEWSATGSVIAEDVSDANGGYLIEFDSKSRTKFFYTLEYYYDTDKYGSANAGIIELPKKSANYYDLFFNSYGTLKVDVNPPPPYNSGDSFIGEIRHILGYGKYILEDEFVYSSGIIVKASDVVIGEHIIDITKTVSGNTSTIIDTVTVNEGQTTEYTIDFN